MITFASQVHGKHAPSLPKPSVVAEAVTDAIAPVLRRGVNKEEDKAAAATAVALAEAAAASAEGGEDATATLEEVPPFPLVPPLPPTEGEVMAAEAGGPEASLRGAAAEETSLENWKYEWITLKASVVRIVIGNLSSSSESSHTFSVTKKEQTRTIRKELYQETHKYAESMSSTIETSMSLGASFPVKAVQVEASASAHFSQTIQSSIEHSRTQISSYETETISTVTSVVSQTFKANAIGEPDKVVYKEVWKLGETVLRELYHDCDVAESEKEGWAMEVEDVTMSVAVDRQWYSIKNGDGQFLNAGHDTVAGLVTLIGSDNSYAQQWTLDQRHLISKDGWFLFCGDDPLCKVGKELSNDSTYTGKISLSGTQLKSGAYCMTDRVMGFPWFASFAVTQECNGSQSQQWSFIKICNDKQSSNNCAYWKSHGYCHGSIYSPYMGDHCRNTCKLC